LCKPTVSSTVLVARLRPCRMWRSWMWRSWTGVVTRGLRLWGRLDVLPNSLKWRLRPLMVEKLTWHFLATDLVEICGIVLCDKSAHFRAAFYCPQHKVHLCNDHAV
jgi:hypothetical protein